MNPVLRSGSSANRKLHQFWLLTDWSQFSQNLFAGISRAGENGIKMPHTLLSPANRLRRVALSLASAVLASIVVCAGVIAFNYEEFSQSFTSWFLFIRGGVLVIMLAWVVTLPLVLLISRFDG